MAFKSEYPLADFAHYLHDRGLADPSISMYKARVRSALRQAKPGELPTTEGLARALLETQPEQRATFKVAWRKYRDFLQRQGYKAVAALPEEAKPELDAWLAPLRKALEVFLPVMPLTPAELHLLNYGRIDETHEAGIVIRASAHPLAKRQPTPKLLQHHETEAVTAFLDIKDWGYPNPDEPPEEDSPFLPYGSSEAMPTKIIQKLCAGIHPRKIVRAPHVYRPADDAPTAAGEAPPSSLFGARALPGEPPKG